MKIKKEIKEQFLGKVNHTNMFKLCRAVDRSPQTITKWFSEDKDIPNWVCREISKTLKIKQSEIIFK